ncbi:hypothetical protein [Crenothrix polyspora]|uniref:Uncharacterized protein n=1 Tax=Crenothrix polyspora TaxID=360316 RepID=A0A1R4HII7_9GAMM|nr:hypothetical protein [Crenothrix polyspora]SJM96052.1 hypothetical protein CRENPOLYSF1_830030 [Crenothrix polyspora]
MNAVVKPTKLETIFDHNITDVEFEEILGEPETLDEYLYSLSQDSAYAHLYFLYELREDMETAKLYLNKIKDDRYRKGLSIASCILSN